MGWKSRNIEVQCWRSWSNERLGLGAWLLTAVVLRVVVVAELLTVVAAAHQVAKAPRVTVVSAPVTGTVTVPLA